ncbi:TetR family transcriptional regulator [Alphaproteobacteria bacterium HT1-32]|nr:TetR family transcriptional regulator [Alphaproteobacteria bacterium HT1-32]
MQQAGRPRKFDPDKTMSQIMQLFWEHGYEATGLSDIIATTGLGKASLYAAFGNKQSMYLKALAHYENRMVEAAVSSLRSPDMAPLERIDAFLSEPIKAVRDHTDRRGCFLCNASADRASLDDDTAALVRQAYDKMYRAIADSLSEAFPDMPIVTVTTRSQLVLTVYSGLRVMARSGMTADTLSLARNAVMDTLGAPVR